MEKSFPHYCCPYVSNSIIKKPNRLGFNDKNVQRVQKKIEAMRNSNREKSLADKLRELDRRYFRKKITRFFSQIFSHK